MTWFDDVLFEIYIISIDELDVMMYHLKFKNVQIKWVGSNIFWNPWLKCSVIHIITFTEKMIDRNNFYDKIDVKIINESQILDP